MEYRDFFGRPIAAGDRVAFIDRHYQALRHGVILRLNEKQATIKDMDYDGPYPGRMGHGMTCRYYSCIVKETGDINR